MVQQLSKDDSAIAFQQWLLTLPSDAITVYSDGSQLNKAVGWGFVILEGASLRLQGHGRLGQAEVFDAEVYGALKGLQSAIQLFPYAQGFTICIDSTAAISSLRRVLSNSSQAEAVSFQGLAKAYNATIK